MPPPKRVTPYAAHQTAKPMLFRILDFDAAELARQISLLDFQAFNQTPIRDFINSKWEKCMILDWGDYLMWWIVSEILNTKYTRDRAKCISHLIDTGNVYTDLFMNQELIKIQNFHALKFLLDAFDCRPVARLTKTFQVT